VSDTSYYRARQLTGYEGTDYNLSYYQGIGWPASPKPSTYPRPITRLIDSAGVHLPPD